MPYYHLLLNFDDLAFFKIQQVIIFICMSACLYVCIYIRYMPGAQPGQKEALNPLELMVLEIDGLTTKWVLGT